MGSKAAYERDIKSALSRGETIVVALASIADGLWGLITLGSRVGTLRSAASLWGARRLAKRQWWL